MEVLKYAEFHFLSEENLMEDVRYPHIAEHRQEHQQLLTRLSELIHLSLHGEHNLRDIASFLFSWFSTHTTQVDQRLTAYIRAQGPAA
jgi:hemerythrin